jgi:hypothetical protein
LDSYFPWKKWTKHVIRHLEVKTKKKTYTFAIAMDSQHHCSHTHTHTHKGRRKGIRCSTAMDSYHGETKPKRIIQMKYNVQKPHILGPNHGINSC